MPEGYFSINDKLSDIMSTAEGQQFVASFSAGLMSKMKNGDDGDAEVAGFKMSEGMMKMMSGFTVKRLLSMMGMAGGKSITKEEILEINRQLNKIRKS